MSFSVSQLFPGIETGLNNIGFLFGAGTSNEAGYPLMPDLTKAVVDNLATENRPTLDEMLHAKGLSYDSSIGEPNIEIISDLVMEFFVDTQAEKYQALEKNIRKLIVENMLSVKSPDLSHHVRFLEALKQRAHGTSAAVTILTTNYDVLFELAAGETGVRMVTGFEGPLKRVFDPRIFDLSRGEIVQRQFKRRPELTINLFKLHGSISWFKNNSRFIESGIDLYGLEPERIMILPRRRKVMDTLSGPFDQLFARASRGLGSKCKYLVSCGFSFGDSHINDQLLFPKLSEGKIRLVALCGFEPDCLEDLKAFRSFHAGLPNECIIDRREISEGTDLWKFSALAEALMP